LSGRVDGSNMFGSMSRSKFLPNYGLGVAWNLDREEFFQNWNFSKHIDFFKLRISHALRGNSFETSPMRNAELVNLIRLDAVNNDIGIRIRSPELFQLNWEKDYITNYAFDLSIFNRINLTAEYYSRINADLVIPFNIALEEGFNSKIINYGTMTNRGVDLSLGFKNILNKRGFVWDVNLIYGYVKNRLRDGELQSAQLGEITNPQGYYLEGYPREGLFAYNFAGLDQEGRASFYGEQNQLTNGILRSSRDRGLISFMGSRQPLSTGSIANSFQYKGFELRTFLTYSLGHKLFTSPLAQRAYNDASSKSGDLNYRWQTLGDEQYTNVPGLISTIQRIYYSTNNNVDEQAYNRSDFRTASGDNLRIAEILLAYDLGARLLRRVPAIKQARLLLSANNVHFWASKRLRGVDPDLYIHGGTSMPNPRSYSLRLTVGF